MAIEINGLKEKALSFPVQAKAIIVRDNETLTKANDFLLSVKKMQKEISDAFDPLIKQAHETHKAILDKKKSFEMPLVEAERIIKPQIGSYLTEQERIRREAEEKARREREEAELRKKAEEEELLKKALEAEAAGKKEKAEQIINQVEELKSVIIETKVPEKIKLAGTGLRKELKWRVKNIGDIPKEYLIISVDRRKIDDMFRLLKKDLSIPGIEVYEETTVVSGYGNKT
jgi:hypothetical protein